MYGQTGLPGIVPIDMGQEAPTYLAGSQLLSLSAHFITLYLCIIGCYHYILMQTTVSGEVTRLHDIKTLV